MGLCFPTCASVCSWPPPLVCVQYTLPPTLQLLLTPHPSPPCASRTAGLHHRTAFTDHADPNEKRHLLRLWLSPAEERELPPVYTDLYGGNIEVGSRGAIHVASTVEKIVEEAE